jgi:hypothetical protein
MTEKDVKDARALALEALALFPQNWYSTGEVTRACNEARGRNIPRSQYRLALDALVKEGEIFMRWKDFRRDGEIRVGRAFSLGGLESRSCSFPAEPSYLETVDGKLIDRREEEGQTHHAARRTFDPKCEECAAHELDVMYPGHNASPGCESGKRDHCTCDVCF